MKKPSSVFQNSYISKMAKVKYEAYEIGSKVFGISHYYKDGKPINYVAIYEATVADITFGLDDLESLEVSYMLKTPDGEYWGDSVTGDLVSDSFDELVARMKPLWLEESSSFGD